MNASERHGVRFGLFPAALMRPATNEGYSDVRLLSVSLMDIAKQQGGMIA